MNSREQYFADTFFKGRPFYQPKFFTLSNQGTDKYTPDFYDTERDTYIEVVGTRQAYHQNKEKYELFQAAYPNIKFELRRHTGEIYHPRENTYTNITNKLTVSLLYLKEKLGSWKAVAELLDITERYCYMIYNTGKCGRHLRKLINQKVELFK